MIVASCPKCSEQVTIPEGVDPESWARCPLCQEVFALFEALDRLPPTLVILDQTDVRVPEESPDGSAEPPDADDELVGHEASPASADGQRSFEFAPDEGTVPLDVGRGPTRRRLRKEKNLFAEVAKVAAGGVIGCGLAVLILWWLVGADPFHAGPRVGRLVPWIVPAKFRGGPRLETPSPPPLEPDFADPRRPGGEGGSSWDLRTHRPASEAVPGALEQPTDRVRHIDLERSEGATPQPAPTDPPTEQAAPSESGAPSGTESEAGQVSAATTVVGVRHAPQKSGEDLKRALQRARSAGDAWSASASRTDGAPDQRAAELYQALARLGEVVTFLQQHDARTRSYIQQMHHLLLDVLNLPDSPDWIRDEAVSWLDQTSRPHVGVVLLGAVRSVQPQGSLYVTRLELGGEQSRVVSVMSRVNPADFYRSNRRVLMLGAIVDRPRENLAGYDGDDTQVIMGGYPLVLPVEPSS